MEFNTNRTLYDFSDEDHKMIHSPPRRSFQQNLMSESDLPFSPPRHSSAFIPPSSSPDSPWTLTPLHPMPSPSPSTSTSTSPSPSPSSSPSLLFQCIASVHRHEGNIYSVAALKGNVFTGSESSRIHVWRQPDCIERGYLKTNSGQVRAILAYGNMLFTSHKDRKIRVWSVSMSDNFRSKKIASIPRCNSFHDLFSRNKTIKHKDCVTCLAYYHAEGLLYTGSWDKTVKTWRVIDQICVDTFVAHEDAVNAIEINQEDGCVFTCSSDGSVKIWRRVFGEISHTLTMTLKFQLSPVHALALSYSINTCYLYSGSSDGFINCWEKEKVSGRFNHGGFLQGHRFAVLCVVAMEKLLISGSEDTTIRVWRREEGSNFHTCLAVLDGHRGPVRCLAACLEMDKVVMGFLVYSASLDGTFKVWRVQVFPEEKKVNVEDNVKSDEKTKTIEYAMSPVLSPSWVEKKLQVNRL